MRRPNSIRTVTVLLLFACVPSLDCARELCLDQPGIRITKSTRIGPGIYKLPVPTNQGAIVIVGDNLTVDLAGVTLVGSPEGTDPDTFTGRGMVIRGSNVTVKNAVVHGYKVGIYAEDSPGLTIDGCDVSRNYRQRLRSTVEREDLSDWLFGHENDDNQWLRYGAGIYLLRCPHATVMNCLARNGQNGLCISRSDRARIIDNDMSFMSGWGLAMWRSSQCEVFNNKFDWCIRGYSHGIYSRGQDSTGILVYEQCNNNIFAFNSATHGGDGFFLYAGNETVKETGRGGCNGNILYRNDFSHAAANGIEATFSEGNIFVENILNECTHGVWAGYSYNTVIEKNTIRNCKYGVSIEHGHDNLVAGNTITDCRLGVHLWWDDDKDLLASPFGQAHDGCRSFGNTITANRFERVETAIRLVDDTGSNVGHNPMLIVGTSVDLAGNLDGVRLTLDEAQRATTKEATRGEVTFLTPNTDLEDWTPFAVTAAKPQLLSERHKRPPFLPKGGPRGREYIFVDEWGPYDFTDVRLFPSRVAGGRQATIQLLGPDSSFRVVYATGVIRVRPMKGRLPAKLTLEAQGRGMQPFQLAVEAGGQELTATGALLNTQWKVAYYGWSEPLDPRSGPDAWRKITEAEPLDELTSPSIDFLWYNRSPSPNVPPDHFATVATASAHIPAGKWHVRTMSDDGIRVFLDGKEVISNWTWHPPTEDEAFVDLESGQHEIRIEHFEIDGHAQLQFHIEPVGDLECVLKPSRRGPVNIDISHGQVDDLPQPSGPM